MSGSAAGAAVHVDGRIGAAGAAVVSRRGAGRRWILLVRGTADRQCDQQRAQAALHRHHPPFAQHHSDYPARSEDWSSRPRHAQHDGSAQRAKRASPRRAIEIAKECPITCQRGLSRSSARRRSVTLRGCGSRTAERSWGSASALLIAMQQCRADDADASGHGGAGSIADAAAPASDAGSDAGASETRRPFLLASAGTQLLVDGPALGLQLTAANVAEDSDVIAVHHEFTGAVGGAARGGYEPPPEWTAQTRRSPSTRSDTTSACSCRSAC